MSGARIYIARQSPGISPCRSLKAGCVSISRGSRSKQARVPPYLVPVLSAPKARRLLPGSLLAWCFGLLSLSLREWSHCLSTTESSSGNALSWLSTASCRHRGGQDCSLRSEGRDPQSVPFTALCRLSLLQCRLLSLAHWGPRLHRGGLCGQRSPDRLLRPCWQELCDCEYGTRRLGGPTSPHVLGLCVRDPAGSRSCPVCCHY